MSRQKNRSGSFDPRSRISPVGTNTTRNSFTPKPGGVNSEPGDNPNGAYEPKNVNLERCEIIHKGGTLKLVENAYSITITESLFENSLTCKFEFLDATEKMAELDPDGTEVLRIAFSSEKNREIDHRFNIYRTEVYPDNQSGSKGKAYQVFGISAEFMSQATMDINRTMKGNVSDMVNIVFNEVKRNTTIQTRPNSFTRTRRRLVDRHKTSGNVILNIPGMTPYETLDMLLRRAYNDEFSSSIFLFYEDFRGYNFCNLEQLVAEGRDDPFEYSYKPAGQVTDQKTAAGQFDIQQIFFPASSDVIEKIKSGAYASQVAEIDIINQKVDRTVLTVKENFKDFYHLDKPAITLDKKTVIDKHLNVINSTTWINKYSDGLRHLENNFGALITRRKFYGDSLGQVTMNCVVPGNSDLSVGSVLDLSMIETSANKDNPEQEKKISGKYLITEVNHQILTGTYSCSLSCNKESSRANVTKIEDYMVGKR